MGKSFDDLEYDLFSDISPLYGSDNISFGVVPSARLTSEKSPIYIHASMYTAVVFYDHWQFYCPDCWRI